MTAGEILMWACGFVAGLGAAILVRMPRRNR